MARILLVDDSNLSRRILRTLLEPAGHQIMEAADGLVALERYALERPDLVLLDLNMEGLHGLEVLDQLRALDPAARVVVASADVQRATQDLARTGGSTGFLTKPFQADQVLHMVTTALRETS